MLTLRHQRHRLEPRLPHLIFIDGHYAATMQGDRIDLPVPPGHYSLRIQCGGRLPLRLLSQLTRTQRTIDLSVSSTNPLHIGHSATTVTFRDRDRLWNILFDIDLLAWLVSLFVTFPPTYKIVSDTFFALWLVRLIAIRKRYYRLSTD